MANGISTHNSFDGHLLQTTGNAYERIKPLADSVFAVRHKDSGCVLVASIIDLERTDDEELEHLKRGVNVTKMLKHANLLPFLTSFVDLKDLWIISPFFG